MNFEKIKQEIEACGECERLRSHCVSIAREKKRQFREESYWGKPVPGFGDAKAKLLIVGLAPAAHGANRTGRMFTGDQSGLWLYRAVYKAGFSNQPTSAHREDGLRLKEAFITAVARCAPPANKPLPSEIEACSRFLKAELEQLNCVRAFLALGSVALRGLWRVLPEDVKPFGKLPEFSHGGEIRLRDGRMIFCSYHPSQQNTFTKKLTEPMFDQIFNRVKIFLQRG
ncbi:MAG: uracil-DNA glycosylase [Bdellovibrionales bacterium]|nr:uracil-DNA glycosylase [Bdellovibrionales bacterium]